jgi:uncharacterized protein (DUF1697 family)
VTYVALLRGINLGARNKVSMSALRELLAELGAEEVRTYVQSGNAVFESGLRAAELRKAIEDAIERELDLEVKVLLRNARQLAKVLRGNPFANRDPATLHVTFLAERPGQARVRELDPDRSPPDEFRVVGTEVYLHCPNGYGQSKLSNAYFERGLGVAATTRNWRTVNALVELADA